MEVPEWEKMRSQRNWDYQERHCIARLPNWGYDNLTFENGETKDAVSIMSNLAPTNMVFQQIPEK